MFREYLSQLGWPSWLGCSWENPVYHLSHKQKLWLPVLLRNLSTLSWRVFVITHVFAVWSHSNFVFDTGFLFTCEDGWFGLVRWWAMVCRRFRKSNIEGWVGADAPKIKKAPYNLPLKYHPDKTQMLESNDQISPSHPCRNTVIPSPLLISLATTIVAPMELPHSRAVALPPPVDAHYACTAISFSPSSHSHPTTQFICWFLWYSFMEFSFQIWWFGVVLFVVGLSWSGLSFHLGLNF